MVFARVVWQHCGMMRHTAFSSRASTPPLSCFFTMSPKRRRTACEVREEAKIEAARLQRRCRTVLHRSQCLDIAEALRQYPELTPNVYEHLTALGVDWE